MSIPPQATPSHPEELDEFAFLPAHRLLDAIARGEVSSQEITGHYLDRIATSTLNAVVEVDVDGALATARRVDAARAAGRPVGRLAGLPVTVKDAIDVAGLHVTSGSIALSAETSVADATAVRRLRDAGAVVVGKTNVPPFCADIQTSNDVYGTTTNPWDSRYTPGGSSGGAAAAVADGLTAWDLGTDIGGSIRIPAHFCGVYGLKPSYGVVPADGYVDRIGPRSRTIDINVFGPLARDPADLSLALDVLTTDPAEVGWFPRLAVPPRRTLRVAAWFDDPECEVDQEYVGLLDVYADRIADHGVRVSRARPPVDFAEQMQLYMDLVLAATYYHRDEQWQRSESARHGFWLERNEARLRLRDLWHRWFAQYDVLLCPVAAIPSLRRDETGTFFDRTVMVNGRSRTHADAVSWCGLIGSIGLPSVVAPIGFTSSGLPVGVQIVGDYLHDRTAVAFAEVAQQAGFTYQRPEWRGPDPVAPTGVRGQ